MTFKKIDIQSLNFNPFTKIGEEWMLITSEKEGVVNTMTASWGSLGYLWNENIATIFIRPQRFTKQFIDHNDYFTISFFNNYKKELGILGTISGKNHNKIEKVGFDVTYLDKQPTFEQANLVFVCKKIYEDHFKEESFSNKELSDKHYLNKDYHTMYIAKIMNVYIKE